MHNAKNYVIFSYFSLRTMVRAYTICVMMCGMVWFGMNK